MPASDRADPFIGRVIGRLTVVSREKRGPRWGYLCRCACGGLTGVMRAEYIARRGAQAACYDCTHHGIPRPAVGARAYRARPESEQHDRARHPQASDPIWRVRAARLAEDLVSPLTTAEIIARARRMGFNEEVAREVLASADGVELVKVHGLWNRIGARREGLNR
jgi:hypothetical protein